MAKKKSSKKRNEKAYVPQFADSLPQNILPMGEHVEEDKNIYISQGVYKEIHRFTKDKTTNESGGILLGKIIEEFGKTNIVIYAFIEAKYCEGTPTTLKFTHESWEYIHKEADKKYPDLKILGWIHTHPNFGIFLSEYDKFIQENFFREENEIAYVIDPIQNIEGFYFWINGKIERCKGFFIFDQTGEKITIGSDKEEETATNSSSSIYNKVLLGLLSAVVVVLIFVCISMSGRINSLETQMKNLTNSANQSLSYLQQYIMSLQDQIQNLTKSNESIPSDGEDTEKTTENGQKQNDSSSTPSNDSSKPSTSSTSDNSSETTQTTNNADKEAKPNE